MEQVDITIIGAGVVGLALAQTLSHPSRALAVVEKNARYGLETSSRNSEVIHAGIYYQPQSLKARLCLRGKNLLYKFCADQNLPARAIGKIITAYGTQEIPQLEALYQRGLENGVSDLKWIDAAEIKRKEPAIDAACGIWSPSSGILSADLLMDRCYELASQKDAMFFTQCRVDKIVPQKAGYEIHSQSMEPFVSRIVINASGHEADLIAQMAGINIDGAGYRQKFVKGEYFRLRKAPAISHLIYPLPSSTGHGMHLTPEPNGAVRIGPSSFPVDKIDYNIDLDHRRDFLSAARRYFPDASEDLLDPDTAGIRPKLLKFNGEHGDFIIRHESDRGLPGFINLIGIDSPGLTSAFALAEEVQSLIKDLI